MNDLSLSLRLTRRDWRAGELRLLLAALVIAVAAVASVGFFVDRMKQALSLSARQLIGADLVLASDQPIDGKLLALAQANRLNVARTSNFPSMAMIDGKAQIASIKAVTPGYPLRGGVRVAPGINQPDAPALGVPARGTVWVDSQLLQALGAQVGVTLQLGESAFKVERVVTLEPDRGANFVNFAPRVMMHFDDLAATQLIQPASRVTYRLQVAGERDQVAKFQQAAQALLERGQRIESLESGRPELRSTVDRAEKFLALVALLTAMIAAVAIALATRRFAERHLDGCAVMRAMGLPQPRLIRLLAMELLWLGLAGGLIGAALGWLVHFALVSAIAGLLEMPLPPPTLWPAVQSVAAGLVLLLGFGAWPFLRLASVPPLRVLRRDMGNGNAGSWVAVVLAVLSFAGLLTWFTADTRLAAIAIGGFAGGTLVFALTAWLVIRAMGPLRRMVAANGRSPTLRLALASWSRRQGATIAQTVALAVGLMALMLLTVTRTDLVDSWRRASPPDAPNRFVINIQPDQRALVGEQLAAAGVSSQELSPMVRGRLIAINGKEIAPKAMGDERAQRLVEREFNLSYGEREPSHNQTVEGRWLDPAQPEVSVEAGIQKTLSLKLDDRLTFEIAGEPVVARVTGVRKLAWDSMKVNFFMILSPVLLRDRPQTLITSYHQPAGKPDVASPLVQKMPNLTIFDMSNIVRQVQTMLDQVIRAVQFLFVLTLVAGMVVLYAALASSRDERIREAGLMRALGASRKQLQRAQLWELAIGGALAGLLASVGALVIGAVLAEQIFQFDYAPRYLSLAWGTIVGAVVAITAGWLGLRGVLSSPPLATLRNA